MLDSRGGTLERCVEMVELVGGGVDVCAFMVGVKHLLSFLGGSLTSLFVPFSIFCRLFQFERGGTRVVGLGSRGTSGAAPPACDSSKDKRYGILFSNTIALGIVVASWSALTEATTSLKLDAISSISS